MKDVRKLAVWQKAHKLVTDVYRLTKGLPDDERYGLALQLRRSASSVTANLAEGCGRNGDAELARFCSIAMGSASELDNQLLLARDLDLISAEQYAARAQQVTEVKRMLAGLIRTLKADR